MKRYIFILYMNIIKPAPVQVFMFNWVGSWLIVYRNKKKKMRKKRNTHHDVIKSETFPALLAICAGNSPVTDEFPAQRPVTRSFDVFFDLYLNKRLSKQSRGW